MKNYNKVAPGCLLAALCLLINFSGLNAQIQTARYQSIISNSNAFYEYLPQGYNSESQSYPLLVFIHGVGELGNGSAASLPTVLRNGPPKLINEGTFPVSFTVNGNVFKFIVISPQFINWPSSADVQAYIDHAINNYRVDVNRIYLTGLSMGGGVTWDYASNSAAYANRLAALVPVCGASGPSTAKAKIIASANLPVWATHNQVDPTVPPSNTINFVDYINASSPAPAIPARKTIFNANGHDAWSATYTPAFKENNLNIYEWMLQYRRGGTQPSNQSPFSNAGNDITITLPDNAVTLAGSGRDNDGSITGYNWSKVSGPSEFSISNSSIANPTISNLVAGNYTLRLTVSDNNGATGSDDVNIKVNAASAAAVSLPGRIEAENYAAMSGIQTENTSDAGAGKNVGFIDTGDWMDYYSNVTAAGSYTVNFRVASPYSGQQLQLRNSSGSVLTTITLPQTGGYQSWTTVTANVSLPAGNQTLRIYSANGSWNINWLEVLTPVAAPTGNQIPGKIEAENYSSMSGVQTENTSDAGAGKNVGFIDGGDWMDYQASVITGGSYTVNIRVASPYASQQLQLKNSSGNILATIAVPQTGAYQNWTTVSAGITLPAGNQTLRIYAVNGGFNINWLEFVSGPQTPAGAAIPGKIEAEDYATMNGVIAENTDDVGSGRNVGFIDPGDWMDYSTTVSAAGTYTVGFRIASPYSGQQLQLKNAAGTVLATISVPQTGGFQNWSSVTASVTLPAGNQLLRIYSVNGGWNINWMEFVSGSQTPGGLPVPGKVEAENYNAMNGIGTENTSDAGGGKNIGWVATGDWLDYNITVASAGTYTVNYRLATGYSNQQIQFRNSAGNVLATTTVPETGGFQNWATVSAVLNLPAGNQTIRIYASNGSWNLNWMEFVSGGTISNAVISNPGLISKDIATQIPLLKESVQWSIFPNPVRDKFFIQLNNSLIGRVNLQVSDLSGKILRTYKFEKNQSLTKQHLIIGDLAPGLYLIKLQMGRWTETKKLIKL